MTASFHDFFRGEDVLTDQWRISLLENLSAYELRFPQEAATIHRFAEFVASEPDCFQRSTSRGHITAAVWLVDPLRTSVLLTHHAKLDKWMQLGGHADGDGNVQRVALCEAVEESGIEEITLLSDTIFDIDIHAIPARGADPAHLHYDVRFAALAPHHRFTVSKESHDLAWVPVTGLSRYTREASMVRMARKWLLQQQEL